MKPSRRQAWAQVARHLGNEPFNHGNILVPVTELADLLTKTEALITQARNAFRMLTGLEDTGLPAAMREMQSQAEDEEAPYHELAVALLAFEEEEKKP